MEKLKVIFRKDKEGNIMALFPELPANYGKILAFDYEGEWYFGQVLGGHMEIDMEYATTCLKLATEKEYEKPLEFLRKLYDDCELVVRKKINYDDLRYKAWKKEAAV